jgi:hypothetical protein
MAMGRRTKIPSIILKKVSNKVGSQVATGADSRLNGSFSIDKKSLKTFFWCQIKING